MQQDNDIKPTESSHTKALQKQMLHMKWTMNKSAGLTDSGDKHDTEACKNGKVVSNSEEVERERQTSHLIIEKRFMENASVSEGT